MILINDETLSNDYNSNSEPDTTKETNKLNNDRGLSEQSSSTENSNSSNRNFKINFFVYYLVLILANLLNYEIIYWEKNNQLPLYNSVVIWISFFLCVKEKQWK